jgi:hypothetical protein
VAAWICIAAASTDIPELVKTASQTASQERVRTIILAGSIAGFSGTSTVLALFWLNFSRGSDRIDANKDSLTRGLRCNKERLGLAKASLTATRTERYILY